MLVYTCTLSCLLITMSVHPFSYYCFGNAPLTYRFAMQLQPSHIRVCGLRLELGLYMKPET